jgi:hypothetical protein
VLVQARASSSDPYKHVSIIPQFHANYIYTRIKWNHYRFMSLAQSPAIHGLCSASENEGFLCMLSETRLSYRESKYLNSQYIFPEAVSATSSQCGGKKSSEVRVGDGHAVRTKEYEKEHMIPGFDATMSPSYLKLRSWLHNARNIPVMSLLHDRFISCPALLPTKCQLMTRTQGTWTDQTTTEFPRLKPSAST